MLLALSFPGPGIGMLAWISLVPLLLSVRGKPSGESFRNGFISGLAFNLIAVSWVVNTMTVYGGLPYPASLALLVLLAGYLSLFFGAFGWLAARSHGKAGAYSVFLLPAFWAALELLRNYLFSGFPWNQLGYSQTGNLDIIQVADITGVYGVSALVVLVNSAVAGIVQPLTEKKRPSTGTFAALAVSACVVIATLAYGSHMLAHQPEPSGKIRVALIQGNIEQFAKWDPAYQSEVFDTYRTMTLEAAKQRPDLIIWPETATPFYFNDEKWRAELTDTVRESGTYLMTGSPSFTQLGKDEFVDYNSAYLISPDGGTAGRYDKMHLVPFGEYVPLKTLLPFVSKMVAGIGDFGRGDGYTVLATPKAAFGAAICFEVIFPELVRQFPLGGANMLTSITNDAWFGESSAPYQHFQMAVMRAVENRRTLVRAANTGITGIILPSGAISARTDIFTRGYIVRDVPLVSELSFYTRHGDLFAYACAAIGLIFLVSSYAKDMYNKKQQKTLQVCGNYYPPYKLQGADYNDSDRRASAGVFLARGQGGRPEEASLTWPARKNGSTR